MAKNYKDRIVFSDFCKILKQASNNDRFDVKVKNVKYHKRIITNDQKKNLLNDNRLKSIITDLTTQTIFRDVCNKYNIYPIEKSNKDHYTYLQNDIDKDSKIWHCHFGGTKKTLFFTCNDDLIYIIEITDYHL